MQDEVRRILESISKKYDISLKHTARIYRAPYSMIREIWDQIDYNDPSTYQHCNLYLVKFGTFFIKEPKIQKIKDKIHELRLLKKAAENPSKSGNASTENTTLNNPGL